MVVASLAHSRGHTEVWVYPFPDAVYLSRERAHTEENAPEQKTLPIHGPAEIDLEPPRYQTAPPMEGYDVQPFHHVGSGQPNTPLDSYPYREGDTHYGETSQQPEHYNQRRISMLPQV